MQTQSAPKPIQILVGPAKDITVTVPSIEREQLRGIAATFFGKGDQVAEARFRELFKQGGNFTLVLTTK